MNRRRSFMLSAALTLGIAAPALLAGCNGSTSSAAPYVASSPQLSFQVTKATPNFYALYTGPQRPAINAVAAGGKFVASTQVIVLDAKMAGPIFDGGPNYFVWGFDRGGATNAPFPGEGNVKFNAVVVAVADPITLQLSGSVNLFNGAPALPVTVTQVAPDTLEVIIAINLLPSTGSAPTAYTWNLWPRSGVGGTPAAQIGSFIPENAMAPLASQ